jgi:AhpD family alkylhydroperoxidase
METLMSTIVPRIAPLPPERWSPELRATLDATHRDGPGRENLFGVFAHHPLLAGAWLNLAQTLTHHGTLPARTRELALLRVAFRLDCAYIRDRHAAHAATAGLDAPEIRAALRPLEAHPWAPEDLAVLRAADELVDRTDLSDPVWAALSARLVHRQMVELLVLVGQCMTVCLLLKTLRTPGVPAVTLDRGRCCSSGQCVSTAPDVFEQNDDDGLVQLVHDRPEVTASVRLAASLCPSRAITLTETSQGIPA